METLTIVASIAGSVLSIILLIKVWGMTNNIKALRDHLVDNDSIRLNVRIALAKKSANMSDVLFDAMFKELSRVYFRGELAYDNFAGIINDYKEFYKRAEIEFPTEFNDMTNNKFMKYL